MISSMSKTVLTSTAAIEKNAALKFKLRPSQERGKADHGWLKTFHTFNFANYYHPSFGSFGPLRVINEDRVEANEGFGTHPHAEFEIFSYIVRGELEHRDSMGNLEIMKRGDIQMTSAGTGIRHSEYNRNTQKQVHFLQIWALPNKSRLPPTYYTRHVTDAEKRQGLVKVVGPNGTEGVSEERETKGPAPVHADLHLFATLLPAASTVYHTFQTPLSNPKSLRKAYIHVVQTSGFNLKESLASGARVKLNGDLELGEGDGAFITGGKAGMEFALENVGKGEAEVLVFDMGE
ncbi:pirin domain-containing protein [Mrakia frigida]|uniref:pirin family protein n=1 Tax=Mrakia frigida TaxID=29902 RepID=UPI003FCC10FC